MIVDERDQKFVLYEMLGIDNLFSTERYGGSILSPMLANVFLVLF